MNVVNAVLQYLGFALSGFVCVCAPTAEAMVTGDWLYVTDVNTGAIRRFGANGQGSTFGSVGLVNPVDLALDAAGNLYVANRSGGISGTIDKFTPSGAHSVFTSSVNYPSGMAFDTAGSLFVAMVGNNTIYKYNSQGQGTLFASSGLSGPLALAFDHQGNLYAANQNNSSIVKFNQAGQPSFFATSGLYPDGLAFDANNNLFVASFGDNNIQKITPGGQSSIFASGLNAPVDVAFDSTGSLFVLNYGDNTIRKYDEAGNSTLFANTGLGNSQALAIYSVPEPGVWVLTVLGIVACFSRARLAPHA